VDRWYYGVCDEESLELNAISVVAERSEAG
jgi:hypothetical protein